MKKADFFANVGGLNITDSPFFVRDDQATGGYNFEYLRTGGVSKRRGNLKLNSSADSLTRTLGMHTHITKADVRTVLRAARQKLQTVSPATGVFTNITDDTVSANTDIFGASSTQPVVFSQFNPPANDISWMAGGGLSTVYGYNGTVVTQTGVPEPTGSFSGVVSSSGGSWASTGTYYYSLALRKTSTQAISNSALDFSAVIANVTDKVTITLPTGFDATKYDKLYLYRSSVSGVSGFTTGVLVAQINVNTANYVDTGTALTSVDNVPRLGNAILDNQQLPSGTFKCIATWKNQLVCTTGNTIYISDPLKPESFPQDKEITVAGAGEIIALGIVNFNSLSTSNTDEYLVVWTTNRMYVVTGSGLYDTDLGIWDLIVQYVDSVGCVGQSTVVNCYGYVMWIDYSGVYAWDAAGKPKYVSRNIEAFFNADGDFDKVNAGLAWGKFFRKQKQVYWFLPHRTEGENKFAYVLDGRLTFNQLGASDQANISDAGTFSPYKSDVSMYGGTTTIVDGNDEWFLTGDSSGFVYNMFRTINDSLVASTAGINFQYDTRWLDFGTPGMAKRAYKVIAWVEVATPKNLTLDFWSNYRTEDLCKTTINVPMQVNDACFSAGSLWDVAVWDEDEWDAAASSVTPVTFNLGSKNNGNEGDAFKFRFSNSDESTPVILLGFSVIYEEISMRK